MTTYEQELLSAWGQLPGDERVRLLRRSILEVAKSHFPEMPPASSLFFLGAPAPVTEPDKWDDPEYRKQYCGLIP